VDFVFGTMSGECIEGSRLEGRTRLDPRFDPEFDPELDPGINDQERWSRTEDRTYSRTSDRTEILDRIEIQEDRIADYK
jgi:hypothetical protein